ncbi:MAG: diaminopimelate decarboxylase [Muribaculaceae bacterium]|nr:diaminopimelate decarboxylase [Muribaculaceae bacterium]
MGNRPNHRLPIQALQVQRTPFYYYDMQLLRDTLQHIKRLAEDKHYAIHYAVKANGNPRIMDEIFQAGLGADLVSGGEIKAALAAGCSPQQMTYSGVGKTDWEIRLGLDNEIGCFNVESVPEMMVINQLAMEMDKTAHIAIRVNPDIDAHTHRYITTGTAHNKFGISIEDLNQVISLALTLPHIHLRGLHFHIGSQITDMQPYVMLCDTINGLLRDYEQRGVAFQMINVGGGLGVDYDDPDNHNMADFDRYFGTFSQHLQLRQGQVLHFELGRSIVAQCGSLISRVLYVKQGRGRQFAILDAGMSDLIRPALYQATHQVQNLTSTSDRLERYDVVGPVCESSDTFASDCMLPTTQRGDLIAIRSAGAYGESMASAYNMRSLPPAVFSL